MATADRNLIVAPTIDGRNSCWARSESTQIPCAKIKDCDGNSATCTSGFASIWVDEQQKLDYLALKLVS